jgi:hypothetical protein
MLELPILPIGICLFGWCIQNASKDRATRTGWQDSGRRMLQKCAAPPHLDLQDETVLLFKIKKMKKKNRNHKEVAAIATSQDIRCNRCTYLTVMKEWVLTGVGDAL